MKLNGKKIVSGLKLIENLIEEVEKLTAEDFKKTEEILEEAGVDEEIVIEEVKNFNFKAIFCAINKFSEQNEYKTDFYMSLFWISVAENFDFSEGFYVMRRGWKIVKIPEVKFLGDFPFSSLLN